MNHPSSDRSRVSGAVKRIIRTLWKNRTKTFMASGAAVIVISMSILATSGLRVGGFSLWLGGPDVVDSTIADQLNRGDLAFAQRRYATAAHYYADAAEDLERLVHEGRKSPERELMFATTSRKLQLAKIGVELRLLVEGSPSTSID